MQPSSLSEAHSLRRLEEAGEPDRRGPVLADILRSPARATELDLAGWDLLIRQARRANLLARLHAVIADAGLGDGVPAAPRRHLESAAVLAAKHARDVRWEAICVERALAGVDVPVILLKGAAYVVADLPAASGRLFSDIDVMVPLDALDAVEARLKAAGWRHAKADAYDDAYYRRWMHQIPPLIHRHRRTVLDVHHTIMPRTSRLRLDPEPLFRNAVRIGTDSTLYRLGDADLVLHSATHLFNEGEFDNGLRDLSDLDLLLRCFGRSEAFWSDLVRRAGVLGLERTLDVALHHCGRVFGTPVPGMPLAALRPARSKGLGGRVMNVAFTKALKPDHPACSDASSALARSFLYARGHYLRMPLTLLVPHLLRKALARGAENGSRGE